MMYKIFGVIMGILMVIQCVIHLRTNKDGKNNIFELTLLAIGAIMLTSMIFINTNQTMMIVISYFTIIVWFCTSVAYVKLSGELTVGYHNKKDKIIKYMDSLYWLFITIMTSIIIYNSLWGTSNASFIENMVDSQIIWFIPILCAGILSLQIKFYQWSKKI